MTRLAWATEQAYVWKKMLQEVWVASAQVLRQPREGSSA